MVPPKRISRRPLWEIMLTQASSSRERCTIGPAHRSRSRSPRRLPVGVAGRFGSVASRPVESGAAT